MQFFLVILVGIMSTGLLGCKETTSSQNIKTAGIAALIDVTATNAEESTVVVQLRVGGDESNTFVVLDSGDELVASVADDDEDMQSQSDGIYEAEFDTAQADTEFIISFEREEDEDAPDSQGTLPAPFTITSDYGATPISRETQALTVTWEPSGSTDDMHLDIDGSCFFTHNVDLAGDPGTYTVEMATLRSVDAEEPESCDATIEIERTREGDVDSEFDSESYFRLHQKRTVTFVSAP